MPLGGKRADAGRRRALSHFEIAEVRAFYEERWDQLSTKPRTLAELNRRERIARLQSEFRRAENYFKWQKPAKVAKQAAISKKIDAEGRLRFVVKKQPRNKEALAIAETINWCKGEFGITITPRRVAECRTLLRRLKAGKSHFLFLYDLASEHHRTLPLFQPVSRN